MASLPQPLSHGQNFVKNQETVLRLLDHTTITAGDLVYDIGAGTGAITEALQGKRCKVIAIEIDKALYEKLHLKFHGVENVTLLHQDFLTYELPRQGEYKIFSNIPFSRTADIVRKVTSTPNPATHAYFIIQRESALKFAGKPYYPPPREPVLASPQTTI